MAFTSWGMLENHERWFRINFHQKKMIILHKLKKEIGTTSAFPYQIHLEKVCTTLNVGFKRLSLKEIKMKKHHFWKKEKGLGTTLANPYQIHIDKAYTTSNGGFEKLSLKEDKDTLQKLEKKKLEQL